MRKDLEQLATNFMNREKYGEEKVTFNFINSWPKASLIKVGLWSNKK